MTRRFIPVPIGITFELWAALVAEQLADLGVSSPLPGQDWREWAQSLLNFPALVSFPDPYGFSKWDDWAVRTLETSIE